MNIPGSAIQIDLMMQLFSQTTTTSATSGLAFGESPLAGSFASMLSDATKSNVDSAELSAWTTESPDSTKPSMPTKQLALICEQFPNCQFATQDASELNRLHDTERDQGLPPSGALKLHQFNFGSLPLFGHERGLALGKPIESTKMPRELLEDDVLGIPNGSVLSSSIIPLLPALQNIQKQIEWHANESSVQGLLADASASPSRPAKLSVTDEQPTTETFAQFQSEPASSNRSIRSFKSPSVNNGNLVGGVTGWQTTGPTVSAFAERSTSSRVSGDWQTNQPTQSQDRTGDVSVVDRNAADVEAMEASALGYNRTAQTEQPIESTNRQDQSRLSPACPQFASQMSASETSHPVRDYGFYVHDETADEHGSIATRRTTPLESRSENRGNWETTEAVESQLIPTSNGNRPPTATADISGSKLASNLDATDSFNNDQVRIAPNRSDSATGETKNNSTELNKPTDPSTSDQDMESSGRNSVNVEFEAPPQFKSHSRFESHPIFETHPRFATHHQSVGNPLFDANLQLQVARMPETARQLPAQAIFDATADTSKLFEGVSRPSDIGAVATAGLPVVEGITNAWFESTTSDLNQTRVTSQERAELQINPGRLITKTRETSSPRKPGVGQTLQAETELDALMNFNKSGESSAVGHVLPVDAGVGVASAKFNQQELELHSQTEPAQFAKTAVGDHAKSVGRDAINVDHNLPESKVEWHLPKVDTGRSSNPRVPDPEMIVESKKSTASNQDANQQFPILSGLSNDQVATRELTQSTNHQSFLEAPVLEKIAGQITEFVDADSGWVSLEIHPPELGRLDILVSQNGNELSAKIVAHEASTCDLLGHQKEELREMLAKNGMDLSNLDISHGRQSDDAANFGSRDRGSENRERSNFASRPTLVEVPKGGRSIARSSGIDLLV